MQTFTDLLQSIFESSKERIKNPLAGSFILCFILYNWRPILLLLFSENSMQEKIHIINNEYCQPLAILLPLLFAIIYTMYLPFLMVNIDTNLRVAKNEKISNLYSSKDHTLNEKLEIANKELRLKNIETGNRDKQDLLDQIDQQAATNNQIVESLNRRIEILNDELSKSTEALKKSNDNIEELTKITRDDKITINSLNKQLSNFISLNQRENSKGNYTIIDDEVYIQGNTNLASFFNDLQKRHKEEIITYFNSENHKFNDFSSTLQKILRDAEIFKTNSSNEWYMTSKGMDLMDILLRP